MNRSFRTGLILLGLLSVGDLVVLALTDGEHPPYAVAALSAALGVGVDVFHRESLAGKSGSAASTDRYANRVGADGGPRVVRRQRAHRRLHGCRSHHRPDRAVSVFLVGRTGMTKPVTA